MSENEIVEIYSDGACSGNPGPGGWGVILRFRGSERELSGSENPTTNNRMELTAAIEGFAALRRPVRAALYTDSRYVHDGITKYLVVWQRNGWKTAAKKPVKNQELWERLANVIAPHSVTFHWLKGHAGHPENERADALARAAIITLAESKI